MADATISAKIRRAAGGDEIAVASGGKITNDGTQAAHIANVLTAGSATSAANATAINSILVALRGVGILASS